MNKVTVSRALVRFARNMARSGLENNMSDFSGKKLPDGKEYLAEVTKKTREDISGDAQLNRENLRWYREAQTALSATPRKPVKTTLTLEISAADADRIAKIAALLETTPEKYARWELISNIGAMSAPDMILGYWQNVESRTTDKPYHEDANEVVSDLEEMFAGKTLKQVAKETCERYDAEMAAFAAAREKKAATA